MQKSSRYLKRIGIGDESAFFLKNDSLCKSCANDLSCEASDHIFVHQCAIYQPILGFQPKIVGMEGVFNTIRPGKAWCERLNAGDTVGLLNVKSGELIGRCEVEGVDSGFIDDMLTTHAHNNHLMLECEKGDAAAMLRAILQRLYGPQIINDNSTVTVIYLRRKHE